MTAVFLLVTKFEKSDFSNFCLHLTFWYSCLYETLRQAAENTADL